MEKESSKKQLRQKHLLSCCRECVSALKILEENWKSFVPGLLTELAIHRRILLRIKRQFRRSKFVQSCSAIDACHRRLSRSPDIHFSNLISKDVSLDESLWSALSSISALGILFRQLVSYSESAAGMITDTLTQEYYAFLGSDVAVLAVSSRIWIITAKVYDLLKNCWKTIVSSIETSGIKRLQNVIADKYGAFSDLEPCDIEDETTGTPEDDRDENHSVEESTQMVKKGKKRKSAGKFIEGVKRVAKETQPTARKSTGALDRFR